MKTILLMFAAVVMYTVAGISHSIQTISARFNNFVDEPTIHIPIDMPSDIHNGGGSGAVVKSSQAGLTATAQLGSDNAYVYGDDVYLLVTLEGEAVATNSDFKRKSQNVSIVIDKSGSMSGEKLNSVKHALYDIGDYLNSDDVVSLVAYGSDVETILPAQHYDADRFISEVERIYDGGGTFLEGGLREGLDQVNSRKRMYGMPLSGICQGEFCVSSDYAQRVILLSDGLANVGEDSPAGLAQIVKNKSNEQDIRVSTIGVGSDYDERLMTTIARAGRGNYYFMRTPNQADEIFAQEFRNATQIVATNVEVRLRLKDGYTVVRGIGYEYVGEDSFEPYDVQAGSKTTYLFKLSAADMSKYGTDRMEMANISVSFDSVESGRREQFSLPVQIMQSSEKVNQLTNDVVYEEYMRAYTAEKLWDTYEELDNHNNPAARTTLDEVYGNLEQANKRLNGLFEADMQVVSERKGFVESIEDAHIDSSSDGKLMQKSMQMESYSRVYNK